MEELKTIDVSLWTTSMVQTWLGAHVRLSQYAQSFADERVDGPFLLVLDTGALQELGVTSNLHRLRISNEIQRLRKIPSARLDTLSMSTSKMMTTDEIPWVAGPCTSQTQREISDLVLASKTQVKSLRKQFDVSVAHARSTVANAQRIEKDLHNAILALNHAQYAAYKHGIDTQSADFSEVKLKEQITHMNRYSESDDEMPLLLKEEERSHAHANRETPSGDPAVTAAIDILRMIVTRKYHQVQREDVHAGGEDEEGGGGGGGGGASVSTYNAPVPAEHTPTQIQETETYSHVTLLEKLKSATIYDLLFMGDTFTTLTPTQHDETNNTTVKTSKDFDDVGVNGGNDDNDDHDVDGSPCDSYCKHHPHECAHTTASKCTRRQQTDLPQAVLHALEEIKAATKFEDGKLLPLALSALRMDGKLVLRFGLDHFLEGCQGTEITQIAQEAVLGERTAYNAAKQLRACGYTEECYAAETLVADYQRLRRRAEQSIREAQAVSHATVAALTAKAKTEAQQVSAVSAATISNITNMATFVLNEKKKSKQNSTLATAKDEISESTHLTKQRLSSTPKELEHQLCRWLAKREKKHTTNKNDGDGDGGDADGGDGVDVASVLHWLGRRYITHNRAADGQKHLLKALKIRESKLGVTHTKTCDTRDALAQHYSAQGRHSKTKVLYKSIRKSVASAITPTTTTTPPPTTTIPTTTTPPPSPTTTTTPTKRKINLNIKKIKPSTTPTTRKRTPIASTTPTAPTQTTRKRTPTTTQTKQS